ncbi:PKD domain-containing protein [Methanosarcina vacuolata]|uniref:Cell surface protein n=1 Tax=Methanosarcina vacuolata Z-761 TaxID=1434123 RepID=A0A0E3Q813_9EURY|nr:PKD domain-containing protein [Methanosarcina vacuolata]AKB45125.1 cell surface protein [Methanosarcina vacuolata Z-761]
MKKIFLPMVLLVLVILLMPTALAAGNVTINDFSSNVTNGNVTLLTRLTGDITGNVTNWKWTFENVETGATTYSASELTTHHNIKKLGVYNVTLIVWGPEGNDTLTKIAYITASKDSLKAPVVDFSASSTSGNAPLNVSFTDNTTGATSWFWKFGDGQTSKERNPTHNYTTTGNYTVILVVNNGQGWSSKTQDITVQSGLPIVDFSADNSSGSVEFTDLSQNATEWNWDFGDGENSTNENPTHTYSAAGNYTVTLTASNEAGSVSKDNVVNVTEEAIANDESDSDSGSSSSSSSSSHHHSSSSGSIGISSENVSTSSEIIHVNGTESESTDIEQNSTATNVSDNVSVSPELQSNVTEAVNETPSEPETQDLEQDNESTAAETEQTPEQTQSSNASGNESTKSPGFEMIYGVIGLLGVSLYRRR